MAQEWEIGHWVRTNLIKTDGKEGASARSECNGVLEGTMTVRKKSLNPALRWCFAFASALQQVYILSHLKMQKEKQLSSRDRLTSSYT